MREDTYTCRRGRIEKGGKDTKGRKGRKDTKGRKGREGREGRRMKRKNERSEEVHVCKEKEGIGEGREGGRRVGGKGGE